MGTAVAPTQTSPSRNPVTSGMDISDSLTGPQKTAVLCMALGTDEAVKLTQLLTPDEAEQITFHIA